MTASVSERLRGDRLERDEPLAGVIVNSDVGVQWLLGERDVPAGTWVLEVGACQGVEGLGRLLR